MKTLKYFGFGHSDVWPMGNQGLSSLLNERGVCLMKLIRCFTFLALAAAVLVALPKAQADAYYGPLAVTVWTGSSDNGVPFEAGATALSLTPTFTFTYTGPLDFLNPTAQGGTNTFALFFGSNSSGISNFSGAATLQDFLNTSMSTIGETGSAINTYMDFSGAYTGGGPVTVTSDDGFNFYVDGNLVFGSPDPRSAASTSGTLPNGTNRLFDIVYVESNGSPAQLKADGMEPTPEPSSLLLLGTGLLGLATLLRKAVA